MHLSSGFVYLAAQTVIPTQSIAEAKRVVKKDMKSNKLIRTAQIVSFAADLAAPLGVTGAVAMSKSKIISTLVTGQTARKISDFLLGRAPDNPIDQFGDALLQGGYDIGANDCVMDRILFSKGVRNAHPFSLQIGTPTAPPAAIGPPPAATAPKK